MGFLPLWFPDLALSRHGAGDRELQTQNSPSSGVGFSSCMQWKKNMGMNTGWHCSGAPKKKGQEAGD